MKAAVVPALGAPLEIRDVPIPTPGPGQVLVRIETAGLCHTDIHAARGEWPVEPKIPLIPGHEGVGVVEAEVLGHAVLLLQQEQVPSPAGAQVQRHARLQEPFVGFDERGAVGVEQARFDGLQPAQHVRVPEASAAQLEVRLEQERHLTG